MPWSSIALSLLGGGLVLGTGALGAASLRLVSPASAALAVYVLGIGEVVLLTEILSPLRLVGRPGYLVGGAIAIALAGTLWSRRGRPALPLPSLRREDLRRHPLLALLAAFVGFAIVYELALVVGTPPNNWDSMTYHLPRAVEWYQRGGVQYYPAHTGRENALQPNAEIEILFTFVFAARETLAALPQLLAELAVLVGVAGIARGLGASRPAAVFAALVTATLTVIAAEAVTTQNDLVTASFVVAAAYFLLGRTRSDVALAGVAVGLALGTKATAFFALPVLLALALGRHGPRRSLVAGGWTALGFVVFGFYGYALNLAETGSALGRIPEVESFRAHTTAAGTVSTFARIYARFVDLSGYHPPQGWLQAVGDAEGAVFDGLGIDKNPPGSTSAMFHPGVNTSVNEDDSFFGPLGFLLVVPLSLVFLVRGVRGRSAAVPAALALAVPAYALGIALTYKYNHWLGRFMIAPVALTTPLAAFVWRSRLAAVAVGLLAATTLVLALLYNAAKPVGLDGQQVIWDVQRAYAQNLRRKELIQVSQALDERQVPSRATIGYTLKPDDWTYPLYGSHLARRLVRLPRGVSATDAEARGIDWILLTSGVPLPRGSGSWFVQRFSNSGWRLLSCSPIYPLEPGIRVVFGSFPTEAEAERLQARAASVGFRAAEIEHPSCRSFRVVIRGLRDLAQARALQVEALASGAHLRSTIATD